MSFEEWFEKEYGTSESVQEFGKSELHNAFFAGQENGRVEKLVRQGVSQPVLRAVIDIINSEPELDDEIPPEMLERIKSGDVDFIIYAMRTAVKMTKDNIRKKVEILKDLRDSEQSA